jgi:hypothetical protein
MTLTIGQATYNGLQIGPGGFFQWNSIDGLTGLPAVRAGNVPRPNDQGMLAGYDYLGERTVTFNLEATAGGGNTMQENLALARAAFLPSTSLSGGMAPPAGQSLVFNLGEGNGAVGVNRLVVCRCEKFDDTVDQGWSAGAFSYGIAQIAVQMSAVDPRIYDATLQSQTVGLTVAAGGWVFPWTFPWTFTTSTGGIIFATNSGSYTCQPVITITGPCLNPRIEQQTTGQTLQFNTQLATGDTLVIDCYAGSAVKNGAVSMLGTLAPGSYVTSIGVPPGANQFGFFSSDAVATAAQMTLAWANTWA